MPPNKLRANVYVILIVTFAYFSDVEAAMLLDRSTENDAKIRFETSLDNTHSTRRLHELSLLKEGTKCDCGKYSHDCWFEEGKKMCRCFSKYKMYKQKGETCEECDCGFKGSTNCEFIKDEKKCTCKPGYVEFDGYCKAVCNAAHPCRNGGVCDQACKCKNGTSGDFCEIVNFCIFESCGQEAKCTYDEKKEKGYCACESNLTYDGFKKICTECDCGQNGTCSMLYGDKRCSCDDNYQYSYATGRCESCYCGENGKCSLNRFGPKICTCFDGYSEKSGICEECYCGRNGSCYFEGETKMCKCNPFHIVVSGICTECDCGSNARCEYKNSKKTCTCDATYAEKSGSCEACNCHLNADCTFSENGTDIIKKCICPEGYEDVYGVCTDIDECREPLTCPSNTTECRNTLGSYECQCKNGYSPRGENRDPKIYGCEETNNCSPDACLTNARCVNIPGNYQCICLNGYTPITSDPRDGCRRTGWKVGYIIGLAIIGFVLILLIAIILLKRKNRRQRPLSTSQTALHRVH